MMSSILAAIAILGQTPIDTVRHDFMRRLKELSLEWCTFKPTEERRVQALSILQRGTRAITAKRWKDALPVLDEAIAALEGRPVRHEDAIEFRIAPFAGAPNGTARIAAYWAYIPEGAKKVEISGKWGKSTLAPGDWFLKDLNIAHPPDPSHGPLVMNGNYSDDVQIGRTKRPISRSVFKECEQTVARFRLSGNEAVQDLARFASATFESPFAQEDDLGYYWAMLIASGLESGKTELNDVLCLQSVRYGRTTFRVSFAHDQHRKNPLVPTDVIFGFLGDGFSQHAAFHNSFVGDVGFYSGHYGMVYVSLPEGADPKDAYDWLTDVRKLKIGKTFAVGYSSGADDAMSCHDLPTPTSGVALIAPTGQPFLKSQADQPVFLAIGDKDLGAYVRMAQNLSRLLKDKPGFEYREYKNVEHLTVLGVASRDAIEFFREIANSKP